MWEPSSLNTLIHTYPEYISRQYFLCNSQLHSRLNYNTSWAARSQFWKWSLSLSQKYCKQTSFFFFLHKFEQFHASPCLQLQFTPFEKQSGTYVNSETAFWKEDPGSEVKNHWNLYQQLIYKCRGTDKILPVKYKKTHLTLINKCHLT